MTVLTYKNDLSDTDISFSVTPLNTVSKLNNEHFNPTMAILIPNVYETFFYIWRQLLQYFCAQLLLLLYTVLITCTIVSLRYPDFANYSYQTVTHISYSILLHFWQGDVNSSCWENVTRTTEITKYIVLNDKEINFLEVPVEYLV